VQVPLGPRALQAAKEAGTVAKRAAFFPRPLMKPSLKAELRCPSTSRIRGLGQQEIVIVPEGSLRTAVPSEGAGATMLVADVYEIQIAVHHI